METISEKVTVAIAALPVLPLEQLEIMSDSLILAMKRNNEIKGMTTNSRILAELDNDNARLNRALRWVCDYERIIEQAKKETTNK
jgi:hypothetical protein